MKLKTVLSLLMAAAAATCADRASAQSELYLTLSDGTLQRVLYNGNTTYVLAGSTVVPNLSEVTLFGNDASLKIYTRTNGAGNNTLREHSRLGTALTQERLLDYGDWYASDIDVQPSTGTVTAFVNETTGSSRVHDYSPVPGTFVDQTIYSGYGPGVSGKIGVINGSNPPATPGNVDLIFGIDDTHKLLQSWAPGNPPPILANNGYSATELQIDGMAGRSFVTVAGTGVQGTPDLRIRVLNYSNPAQIVAEAAVDSQFPLPRSFSDLDHLSNSVILTTTVDTSGIGRLEGHVPNLSGLGGNVALKGLIEEPQGGPIGTSFLTVDPNNVIHTLDSAGNLSAYRVTFLPDDNLNFSLVARINVGIGTSLDAVATSEAIVPEPGTLIGLLCVIGGLYMPCRRQR